VLNPGAPAERVLPKIDLLALEPGDVLSVQTPGGGGHGNPLERPGAEVLADVAAGLVSVAHARLAYGVVVSSGAVDQAATASLRDRRGATAAVDAFDFGPARDAHERRWPPDLQDAFVALLMSLPPPYRAYVRRELYPKVTALSERGPVSASDLTRLWRDLAAASRLPEAPVVAIDMEERA
jgi:N-methylhydantoinase B